LAASTVGRAPIAAAAPPILFWFYRVVAGAAEPWGQLRRRRACNNTVMGAWLWCVLALVFQDGGTVLFIRWRVGCRAPRRIKPELWTAAFFLGNSFLGIRDGGGRGAGAIGG
jgi:hypothetical protein